MKIQDKLNISEGFSARADFEALEEIGWDFTQIYKNVANGQEMSLEQAEAWEKENYHVRLYWNEYDECIMWIPSHNTHGDTGDAEDPGDQKQAHKDIAELYDRNLLWDVENGEA